MSKKKTKTRATWKDLKSIAERNSLRLEKEPDDFLLKDVRPYQEKILSTVEDLIQTMESDQDGSIKKNKSNLAIINKINDELYYLGLTGGAAVVNALLKRINSILKDNFNFYGKMLGTGAELSDVKREIEDEVNDRFGIGNKGELIKNGFLFGILYDSSIVNNITQKLYTSIYANSKTSGVIKEVKAYLRGHKGVKGAVEDFYSKKTMDVFNHSDRMASRAFANKYDLKYFIYAGTLVPNSRKFCVLKAGGIYSVTEAEQWIFESPAPVGVSAQSYSPTIHMGGVNCRHSPVFITDAMKSEYEEMLNASKK